MNLIPFKPNHRTHERNRLARVKERERLIKKIGVNPDDAPLYDEELKFMVYEAMLKDIS